MSVNPKLLTRPTPFLKGVCVPTTHVRVCFDISNTDRRSVLYTGTLQQHSMMLFSLD